MDNMIYAGLSSQLALRQKLDIVANNIANISTTGFKKENSLFAEYFQGLETEGDGVAFVQDVGTYTSFQQGALQQTGNDLDIAVQGDDNVLSVQTPEGTRYTRDGRLSRSPEGALVMTVNGYSVLDDSGAELQIPQNAKNITIARSGTVSADGEVVGRIGVFKFDKMNMNRNADGLFEPIDKKPLTVAENANIAQGFLESSNVNAVMELTNLIDVQRAYEQGANLMDMEHNRILGAVKTLGRSN